MKIWISSIVLLASVLPAISGTINITNSTEITLATGNTLEFTFSEYPFAKTGASGVATYPARVTFELLSLPETGDGRFLADLVSGDGSFSVEFPSPVTWQQGAFQGAGYTGPISSLYGSMPLPDAVSSRLFRNGSAVLVLTNAGPSVTVGLPPYDMVQDLTVSLSTGGFGVGAVVTRAQFDPPDAPSGVPEPGAGVLAILGFCTAIGARKRISHRNIQISS